VAALAIIQEQAPEPRVDGEMPAMQRWTHDLLKKMMPDSRLKQRHLLVLPNIEAATLPTTCSSLRGLRCCHRSGDARLRQAGSHPLLHPPQCAVSSI